MNEIMVILLSCGTSAIVSMASVTSKARAEISEKNREKREDIYIETLELLFNLQKNPTIIFNEKAFLTPLLTLRPKLRLYGSLEVNEIIKELFDKASQKLSDYNEEYNHEYTHVDISNSLQEGAFTSYEEAEYEFHLSAEQYREDNGFEPSYLRGKIEAMIDNMKKEIA